MEVITCVLQYLATRKKSLVATLNPLGNTRVTPWVCPWHNCLIIQAWPPSCISAWIWPHLLPPQVWLVQQMHVTIESFDLHASYSSSPHWLHCLSWCVSRILLLGAIWRDIWRALNGHTHTYIVQLNADVSGSMFQYNTKELGHIIIERQYVVSVS